MTLPPTANSGVVVSFASRGGSSLLVGVGGSSQTVKLGLGRTVALYSVHYRSIAHSLHTIFSNVFGTSISEATMRPNPR
jgi:hypothetical protein